MIFSKFFKPKWQHKEASVRVLAINEELSVGNSEHEVILQKLLKEDASELVQRAVLLKFNQFELWLDNAKSNSRQKLKEYCQKQVKQILADEHEISLTSQEKQTYLGGIEKSYLDGWLAKEQDADVVIALCQKIDKPQMLVGLFTSKPFPKLQHYILEQTSDLNTLEKLFRKAQEESVKSAIESKVFDLKEAKDKPIRTKKTAQLILSKLLSLKDIADYEAMLTKKEMFESEWSDVQNSLDCLSEEESLQLLQRFTQISEQIQKAFAAKAEVFEQQKIELALIENKTKAKKGFDESIATLGQSIANAIFANEEIDQEKSATEIEQLKHEIVASVLDSAVKKSLSTALSEQQHKLTQLPVIAKSVAEGTQLISRMAQFSVPTNLRELSEKLAIYDQWQADWKQVAYKAAGFLPASIVEAHNEIQQTWKTALKPLFGEQKKQFSQAQRKIADINRLIGTGKYNASFGVFKKLTSAFEELNDNQKFKLQREYDAITEKMNELSDWEHYIATPRKQSLLEEIQAIVDTPLDNPSTQADKVKEFRKNWNALGHADDELEKELNAAFNKACEEAFAPCREFYSQQEAIRNQHLKAREKLIEEAISFSAAFDKQSADWKAIDTSLNKIQQRWKESGDVDRSEYGKLQTKFNNAIKPVKQAIYEYHLENCELKKSIIEQAKAELESEDINATVNKLKSLQAKWREIGFAGPREENKLWSQFRKINDAVFSRRDQESEKEKNQQSQFKEEMSQKLETIITGFDALESLSDLSNATKTMTEFKQVVLSHRPVMKGIVSAVEKEIAKLEGQQKTIREKAEKKQWLDLFSVLEKLSLGTKLVLSDDSEFQALNSAWKKRLNVSLTQAKEESRALKTLELEILAGVDSPEELSQERMKVQVELMQDQMLSGNKIDLQASLNEWVDIGAFTKDDQPLIQRLKPIFCR